jgi:hypothetical protein
VKDENEDEGLALEQPSRVPTYTHSVDPVSVIRTPLVSTTDRNNIAPQHRRPFRFASSKRYGAKYGDRDGMLDNKDVLADKGILDIVLFSSGEPIATSQSDPR